MIHLSRNPEKLEQKAVDYERKGKPQKAVKCREKASKLRAHKAATAGHAANPLAPLPQATQAAAPLVGNPIVAPVHGSHGHGSHGAVQHDSHGIVPRTPAQYEKNALKWEQRGNWQKAQKNREKVWRLRNPQHSGATAPQFYNNNNFLGYDVPLSSHGSAQPLLGQGGHGIANPLLGQQGHGIAQPLLGQQGHGIAAVLPGYTQSTTTSHPHGVPSTLAPTGPHTGLLASRDPVRLEARAAEYDRKGKPAKAQKLRAKAAKLRGGTYTSSRTPQFYETQAAKWEQRGNYEKAQKNRAKYWRHQNPQYAQHAAPLFYNNNSFLGYNVPVPGFTQGQAAVLPSYSTTTATSYAQGVPSTLAPAGAHTALLASRDPVRLEARAADYERRGKTAKAQKLREKAARIRAGTFQSNRNPQIYEAKALQYEQAGNYKKAQKIREKVWRLQNPTYLHSTHPAPQFYESNRFLGYNIPFSAASGFQQTGFQQTSFQQTTVHQTGTQTIYAAPIVEQVVRPVIVEQTSRPERIVEVQPIIHREVDAPTVKIIEQHVYETVPASGPSTVTRAAIVQETVIPRIIEEVQPIIHREVPAPFVERVEQHTTEHIVNPTIQTREVINVGTTVTSVGAPIVGQTTLTTTTLQKGSYPFGYPPGHHRHVQGSNFPAGYSTNILTVPSQPIGYTPGLYQYSSAYAVGQPFALPTNLPPHLSARFQQASQAFRQFDTNHSGGLTKREWKRALAYLGFYIPRSQGKTWFKLVDRDGSGRISEREFCEWWVQVFPNN